MFDVLEAEQYVFHLKLARSSIYVHVPQDLKRNHVAKAQATKLLKLEDIYLFNYVVKAI
jgi:hypothetical protein